MPLDETISRKHQEAQGRLSSAFGRLGPAFRRLAGALPGIALCLLITLVSYGVERVEVRVFGHPYVEALVVAILLGMAVRSACPGSCRSWSPAATRFAAIRRLPPWRR